MVCLSRSPIVVAGIISEFSQQGFRFGILILIFSKTKFNQYVRLCERIYSKYCFLVICLFQEFSKQPHDRT